MTKMPENDNRANLTDLTIRTSAFMQSERQDSVHGAAGIAVQEDDEESAGYAAAQL